MTHHHWELDQELTPANLRAPLQLDLDTVRDLGRRAFRSLGNNLLPFQVEDVRRLNPYGRLTLAAFVWNQGFEHELRTTTVMGRFGLCVLRPKPIEVTLPNLDQRSFWRRVLGR